MRAVERKNSIRLLLAALVLLPMGCRALKGTETERQKAAAQTQQTVRFGKHEVKPELNVFYEDARRQDAAAKGLGEAVHGKLNVLIQFARTPDSAMRRALFTLGAELGGYVGGNAYYAQIPEGARPADFAKAEAIAVVAMQAEWKVSDLLTGKNVPDWANRGGGLVEVVFRWFPNVDAAFVKKYIAQRGYKLVQISDWLSSATVTLPLAAVMNLAAESWVQHVGPVSPPMELYKGGAQTPGQRDEGLQQLRKRFNL